MQSIANERITIADLNNELAGAERELSRACEDCLQSIPGAASRADAALVRVIALQTMRKAARTERAQV